MSFYSDISFFVFILVLFIFKEFFIKKQSLKENLIMVNLIFVVAYCFFAGWMVIGKLIFFAIYQMGILYYLIHLSKNLDIKKLKRKYIFLFFIFLPIVALKKDHKEILGASYMFFRVLHIYFDILDKQIKTLDFKNIILFWFFFPSLSTGPIDRLKNFNVEIEKDMNSINRESFMFSGFSNLGKGLVYKFSIAIILSHLIKQQFYFETDAFNSVIQYVNFEYLIENIAIFKLSLTKVFLFYLKPLELYFDFAGYSLMAMGTAQLFYVNLPKNFNEPFKSLNIKDFWNRWHMSLSYWFRDYVFLRLMLYIKRKSLIKNQLLIVSLCTMFSFLLMGLWHGFTQHYLIYGLYQGLLIVFYELWLFLNKKYWQIKIPVFLSWMITIHFVFIGLNLFLI